MKRLSVVLACLIAVGCVSRPSEPAAGKSANQTDKPTVVEPATEPNELECLDRFNIKRYPVGAWLWGDRFPKGVKYDGDAYFSELKEAGFNTFLSGTAEVPFANKYDFQIMFGIWKARLPQVVEMHKKYGDNPAIIGYHLNDNCDLHGYTVENARWLEKNAPDKLAWMSTNPNPVAQSEVPMPVVSTQAYSFTWFGAGRTQVTRKIEFANSCNRDRTHANRYNMAAWPLVGAHNHGEQPSQYRFMVNTAAAYGAQGVWLFCYNRYFRPVLNRAAGPANRYLTDIAGPHILGRRSVRVFHTGPDLPGEHVKPGRGKLIVKMDEQMLAGVLVLDKHFKAGIDAPDYVMVVDKRTAEFKGQSAIGAWTGGHSDGERPRPKSFTDAVNRMYSESDPKPRVTKITFGKRVRRVDALLPNGKVKRLSMDPAGMVVLPPLLGGGAIMLRIDAKPVKLETAPADTEVWTLPNNWKFKLDRKNVAEKEKWFDPAFDDSEWKEILSDKYCGWTYQGYGRTTGNGWYRRSVTIPGEFRHYYVYLHFGAADEEAWVYVDGVLAFEHNRKSTGLGYGELWTRPFHFECSKLLRPGKQHALAVRVHNVAGAGGLYRAIHLIGSDKELDREQIWNLISKQKKETPKK